MDVIAIVKDYLEENGFDGLVLPDEECGCVIDDLAPCLNDISQCRAGYKVPCDCGDNECVFHISVSRPTPATPDLRDTGANSNPSPDTPKQVS